MDRSVRARSIFWSWTVKVKVKILRSLLQIRTPQSDAKLFEDHMMEVADIHKKFTSGKSVEPLENSNLKDLFSPKIH